MGDKYLAEVLSGKDIVQIDERRICILSGVGSGKNWFVENELVKYGNILYISSRRAKVNEILENNICNEMIQWDREDGDIVTTTNYGIEKLVKNRKFGRNFDDIINHFNFVVIDEAHSLFTDATFAESVFHVHSFVDYVLEKYQYIKVILMTGTPEPMEKLLEKYWIIDKREKCINVLPKMISVIDRKTAYGYLKQMPKNEKTVYYSNSATKLIAGDNGMFNQLLEIGFEKKEIAICMSEKSCNRLKKSLKGLEKNCEETKECILKERKLPNKSRILLTTSSLKEGINLEDENIKQVFCESHVLTDIQQFVGRVRNGVDVLYIISDAMQHDVDDEKLNKCFLELHYGVKAGVPSANEYLCNELMNTQSSLYAKNGYDKGYLDIYEFYRGEYSLVAMGGNVSRWYIDMVESKNQYIKFNHLKAKFEVFLNRYLEQRRINKILKNFKWMENLEKFADEHNIEYIPNCINKAIDTEGIIEYLENVTDDIKVDDEKDDLLNTLRCLMYLPLNARRKSINNNFKAMQIPYQIKEALTTRQGKSKRGIRVIRIESEVS